MGKNSLQKTINMNGEVSFKVSLLDKDNIKSEVRRFAVPQDCSTSLVYLKEKLRTLFGPNNLNISWQDQDGDNVLIETDEELTIALQEMTGPVYKLEVAIKEAADEVPDSGPKEQHLGVTCDACDGPVIGFRYKCVRCPDYDLCSTCEAKGFHPGHNMMRIATPETIWPRHFFNRLNKMHERAHKMREETPDEATEAKRPRGSRCGRAGQRGERGCGARGAGWGQGAFGPIVMGHLDQLRAALNPFGMNMDVDVHIDPQGGCTAANAATSDEAKKQKEEAEKKAEEAMSKVEKDVMEAMKNLGKFFEAASSTESTTNGATESNVANKEAEKPKETQHENKDANVAPANIQNLESMTENMNLTEEQQGARPKATKNLEKEAAQDSEDPEWTVLDKSPPSPRAQGAEPLYPELDAKKELSSKVKVALQAMENMGFNNQGGWLSTLLIQHDGDIGKVLDMLSPAKPFRA